MKDSKHHNSLRLDAVKHGVWKAARWYAANIGVLNRKAFWVGGGQANCAIDLGHELRAKPRSLHVVSKRGSIILSSCGAPEYDF